MACVASPPLRPGTMAIHGSYRSRLVAIQELKAHAETLQDLRIPCVEGLMVAALWHLFFGDPQTCCERVA